MGLLQKLLSALGLRESDGRRGSEPRGEPTVTVEHEPDADNEGAVKGTGGVSEGTAASGSTGTITDTGDAHAGAAEPSEAAGEAADDAGSEVDTDAADSAPSEGETGGQDTVENGADGTGESGENAAVAGDVEDESGSSESTDVLNGIGPAYAERLENAGVETVADLAAADAADLAEETGLGEGRIANWIEQAEEY